MRKLRSTYKLFVKPENEILKMKKVRSSYSSSFWFLLALEVVLLFFILSGIWNDAMFDRPFDPAFIIAGVLPLGFAILLIAFYPVIIITEEGIYKKRFWLGDGIRWDSIKQIELLGCATGFGLGDYEGTLIYPEKGKPLGINMDRYKNRSALRQIIFIADKLRVENKPFDQLFSTWKAYDFNSGHVRHHKKLDGGESQRFAGNPWLTLNAFIMIAFAILGGFMVARGIQKGNIGGLLFATILPLIFIVSLAQRFCFFKTSDERLTIRSHLWPSPLRNFQWQEVRMVMIMRLQKRSATLIVITQDFSSFQFGASALRTENWDALEEFLRKMDVPVQSY